MGSAGQRGEGGREARRGSGWMDQIDLAYSGIQLFYPVPMLSDIPVEIITSAMDCSPKYIIHVNTDGTLTISTTRGILGIPLGGGGGFIVISVRGTERVTDICNVTAVLLRRLFGLAHGHR